MDNRKLVGIFHCKTIFFSFEVTCAMVLFKKPKALKVCLEKYWHTSPKYWQHQGLFPDFFFFFYEPVCLSVWPKCYDHAWSVKTRLLEFRSTAHSAAEGQWATQGSGCVAGACGGGSSVPCAAPAAVCLCGQSGSLAKKTGIPVFSFLILILALFARNEDKRRLWQ